MPAARKRIPKATEHIVREQCGQACANPKCREWSTATHELHHINSDRSESTAENLLLLCGSCHNKMDSLISQSDVQLWKRMAEHGYLPPPKGQPTGQPTVSMRDNHGVAAATVNIGTLNLKRDRKAPTAEIPGTIGADGDMRTYANYLVSRYIDWRKKGARFDRRKFKPGSAHGILAEGFGSPASVLQIPQQRFKEWVGKAQFKIDRTIWGKQNPHRNYHSWDDHLSERHGGGMTDGESE